MRIGANRFGSRYELVPRTVYSTLLLLVPREQAGRMINLVSRPSYTNAENGRFLDLVGPTGGKATRIPDYVYDDYCLAGKGTEKCTPAFTTLIRQIRQGNSLREFKITFGQNYSENPVIGCKASIPNAEGAWDNKNTLGPDDPGCVADLWAALERQVERLNVANITRFETPTIKLRDLPPNQQAVAEASDTSLTVRLAGVDPWLQQFLKAKASVSGDCDKGTKPENTVLASSITVSGDVASFNFPAICRANTKAKSISVWLAGQALAPPSLDRNSGFSALTPKTYQVVMIAQPKGGSATAATGPTVTLKAADMIYLQNGMAKIKLLASWADAAVGKVSIETDAVGSGLVTATSKGGIDSKTGAVTIDSPGQLVLDVEGIDRRVRSITLKAQAFGKGADAQKPVGIVSRTLVLVEGESGGGE